MRKRSDLGRAGVLDPNGDPTQVRLIKAHVVVAIARMAAVSVPVARATHAPGFATQASLAAGVDHPPVPIPGEIPSRGNSGGLKTLDSLDRADVQASIARAARTVTSPAYAVMPLPVTKSIDTRESELVSDSRGIETAEKIGSKA